MEKSESLKMPQAAGDTAELSENHDSERETVLGTDISIGPRVHYMGISAGDALRYAQGSDIHINPGTDPHLPHEDWHVVQFGPGRIKPTP